MLTTNLSCVGKAYQVNVSKYESVKKAVDEIVQEFDGRLDVFVANSGIAWEDGQFLDGNLDNYERVMRINVDGTFFCARAAALHWRRQKKEGTTVDGKPLENFKAGSFIATASISAHVVNIPQGQACYNSKAAVVHGVRSLAIEFVDFARANTISPGYIKTEITKFIPKEVQSLFQDKTPMG